MPAGSNSSGGIQREVLDSRSVRLTAGACSFTYIRMKPSVLLLKITGDDLGQFGSATVDELNAEFERFGAMVLFVDTQVAVGPATEVMEAWTAYFAANRKKFKRIAMLILPESKLLHLTVSIVQHLSGIGRLLQIYSDPLKFDAALKQEAPNVQM